VSSVDLIVATYNGHELLRTCLEHLRTQTIQNFRLVIIDDGSTPPVAPLVHALYPQALVLRSVRNQGLVRGLNAGIAAGDSELIVTLNDDTLPEPNWLEELVACAQRHPTAGSVATKLRLASDRGKLHSAGDSYSVRAMPGNRGVWLDDFGQYDVETQIFGACGGAALYRRAALDTVKLANGDVLDRRLFMYCEDVDLAWRLQLAGWDCIFAPRSVVFHQLSATGGGTLASYYVNRNLWLVYARSVPRELFRPFRARILAFNSGRAWRQLRHLREPAARAALRGTIVGLAWLTLARQHHLPDGPTRERILGLLDPVNLTG
jgi:GT2 family glycosyltransferase